MKGTRAAVRYAKAILDMALSQNSAEVVNNDMQDISKTIAGSEDLKDVLSSPVIKADSKKKALNQIFKAASPVTLGAFDVLLENKRISILKMVADKYTVLYNEANKTQIATVTTAIPLSPNMEAKIMDKITELTGTGATIKNIIDPSIIGGFVLRIGDMQYNASVANNLNVLKRQFSNNTYISKI